MSTTTGNTLKEVQTTQIIGIPAKNNSPNQSPPINSGSTESPLLMKSSFLNKARNIMLHKESSFMDAILEIESKYIDINSKLDFMHRDKLDIQTQVH
ncbi:uncharacterized protein LOC144343794 isoform X2 [Saccoglossus kowalevskii]